jgi:hypothetical protein
MWRRNDTHPGTQPKASREDRLRAKRQERDKARAALRKQATRLVSHATGRHYQRVGFATTGRRIAAFLLLVCVMLCVGAMSWSGEFNWAQHHMGWGDLRSALAPGALDFAAMYCALRGLDLIDKGFSAVNHRLMAAVLVGLGAWINWRNELPSGDITKEAFFPIMTLILYWIIHTEMSTARKEAKLRQHGLKSRERTEPLPNLGILVWLPWIGDPREAWAAWRLAIRTRLAKAIARTQIAAGGGDGDTHDEDRDEEERDGDDTHDDAPSPPPVVDLTQLPTQADAIRWVWANVPYAATSNLVALEYLRTHGFPNIKPQRIHDQRKRDAARNPDTQPATADPQGATTTDAPATGGA